MNSVEKVRIVSMAVITLLLTTAISLNAAEVGPAKGSLVLVGGNMRDDAIVKRIIDLAGGPDELIVIIPTAGGAREYNQDIRVVGQFRASGAKNLEVMHTYDRGVADSEKFTEPLRRARGVFFGVGRPWRLADAYLNTRTHRELQALLDRGGVVSGNSGGATFLGAFLTRGDTKGPEVMAGDHQEGLGFLRNFAFDGHLLQQNRQWDLIEVIRARPNLLGVGIDEDTAIVVQQDEFEVIGRSYVGIYDNRRLILPNGLFYFLAPGNRYNLATREASGLTKNQTTVRRVEKGVWPK